MNAATFYILGAVIVAGALAAVGLPRARDAAAGLLLLTSASGILAIASGAYLTGVVEIVAPALAVVAIAFALHRGGYGEIGGVVTWSIGSSVLAGGIAAGFGVILLVAFVGNSSDWHLGSGGAALLTLLHYRAPFALVGALLALVVGVAGALLIGRRSEDEREYDRTHEARRLREERTQRRREDREAARRSRRASPAEGSG
jgi:hypothetical protein